MNFSLTIVYRYFTFTFPPLSLCTFVHTEEGELEIEARDRITFFVNVIQFIMGIKIDIGGINLRFSVPFMYLSNSLIDSLLYHYQMCFLL